MTGASALYILQTHGSPARKLTVVQAVTKFLAFIIGHRSLVVFSAYVLYVLTDNPDLRYNRSTGSGQSVWRPDIPQCAAQGPSALSRRFSRKLG